MSLGWQTESALLPSNSKPINVDGKSLVGLKALLYDQQQQRASGHDSNVRNARNVYSKRKEDKATKGLLYNSSTGKNRPLKEKEDGEDEPNVLAALTAKSKLYEEISSGKVKLQSDVVNFEGKVNVESMQHKVRVEYVPPPLPPSMPNPAKKAEKSPVERPLTFPSSSASDNYTQNSSQPQWNWSTTYGAADNDPTVGSTGSFDHSSEFRNQNRREAELKRTVEGRIQAEVGSSVTSAAKVEDSGEQRVSEAARVKSQWEKALNSSARDFLEQVHDDTTAQRAAAASQATNSGEGCTQKRSLREEKLELIRQKRSKMV
eukprot:gene17086-19478_t